MVTKGERTRRRILATVVDLLGEVSYESMSIAEITRRADVTRPAFYFHFPSKGAALAAVLEDLVEDYVVVASAWYEHPDADPIAGVHEALAATVELWRSHARLMDAVVRARATDTDADRMVTAWVAELAARATERLRRDLGPHLTSGGPSVEALATFLVGATFDTMCRDVRSVVETGEPEPETLSTLVFVWGRVVSPGR